jgi:hypothetical protein
MILCRVLAGSNERISPILVIRENVSGHCTDIRFRTSQDVVNTLHSALFCN